MSQPGLGVLLQWMGGNVDSVNRLKAAEGKRIAQIAVGDKVLRLTFEDGTVLALADMGQSCCEHRYLHTDDHTAYFVGAVFTGVALKEGPTAEDKYGGEHEQQFLEIQTDRGVFTLTNHNEHNGYYGGFAVRAIDPDETVE